MGAIKTENYSKEQLRSAELGRAIGAPARILILKHLKENTMVTGPQLEKLLKLNASTIYQHVQVLIHSGLLTGNYWGNEFGWSLNENCTEELDRIDPLLMS